MKKRLVWIGLITLILFPALGWFILQFFDENATNTMLRGSLHPFLQILIGFAIGGLFGWIARMVIGAPFMGSVLTKYVGLTRGLKLNNPEIVALSFCAGFGEELLFRGALQPLMGIWITAIIFVAIHGYLNPFNWRLSIYGLTMTCIIAALGYITEVWGIFTACSAHMAIDIVLFRFLINPGRNSPFTILSKP